MLQNTNLFLKETNLIDGEWCGADNAQTFAVVNPANGEHVGQVPNCGRAETRRAIEAANRAYDSWRRTSAKHRGELLHGLHDLILENQNILAELLVCEQGKPLAEAMGEIAISAAYIRWFAEEARRVYGDIIPSPWPDRKLLVSKEPVGVVAAITPWNFPSAMLARKIGPALATGCSCIVKPASQTPYSGLAWGVLCEKAGIPPGVVNIVTGSAREIGDEICRNPLVKKITFTGSTEVGKVLLRKAAGTVKKMSMELGGNAPFIVFDDADIDKAIEGAMIAKYRNSGQTCVCTNRFFVQSRIYKTFVSRLAEATAALKVGPGMEPGNQQGPLIDERAVNKVEALIADAVQKGGQIVTGGKRHARGGQFFEPTVIANAKQRMRVTREEIFGPVSPVYKFSSESEVIGLANNTVYGLACYFYTKDLARTFRMTDALKYGLIGVNDGLMTTAEAPFGGLKESGLGKEGGYQGIEDYLDTKYASIGGLDG